VENGCGYCSNDRNCTTQNSTSCPEHTWTNCCPTIASCKQCTKQSDCGYCKDFGCKEGSSAGANGFQCKNWTFDGLKCDEYDPSGFDATLVVIISGIVVGALVIIAVGVLIILFLVRKYNQKKAEEAIKKHMENKRSKRRKKKLKNKESDSLLDNGNSSLFAESYTTLSGLMQADTTNGLHKYHDHTSDQDQDREWM